MGRYRSTSTLPLPADWERKAFGAFRYLVLPFAVALALWPPVLVLAWIVVTGQESLLDVLLGLVLLGPTAATFTAWAWSELPRKAPVAAEIRATDTGSALVLPVPRPSSTGSVVSIAIGVALIGAGLWQFIASLDDEWSMGAAYFFLISLPALFAILLGLGTYKPRKAIDDVGILLTPHRITIEYGNGPTEIAWQDISAVGGRSRREGFKFGSGTNVTTLVTGDADTGYGTIDIGHKDLETDPTRVYHLFVFYVRNPSLRSELGTEQGLERFRRGEYTPERPQAFID
ncbi:hypothetical protein APR12_000875 [Nocardia amikacinitolerans]|uniref:hypothetical protein n=1 Tax=Nocardia amikacinitolerans TaxID=756689 RepID=UPI000A437A04|nr:hypothetical protein [Nocardia amikacinitolerans]MCP2315542.1 hypothetical protein [Nocardia amikacinitolerans]